VQPPGLDELDFIAQLAERFGVEVDRWAQPGIDDHAPLPPRRANGEMAAELSVRKPGSPPAGHFALVRYRALFSGPAVERIPQLQFQRPVAEVELAHVDARERGIGPGDPVRVSSNGTSVTLSARLNRRLLPGVVRIASEHAGGLADTVEIAGGEA
jgi:anaerobic selenocysteine-containing dehydrogenase